MMRNVDPSGRSDEDASTSCSPEQGDVIFTNTPTGAGARFGPPRYLTSGDAAPGIGALRNTIADEGT